MLDVGSDERFVFQWKSDDALFIPTVEIDFELTDRGTIIRLIEYGYPDTPGGLKNMLDRASGWGHVLTFLKYYLEYGVKY